jgi:phosphoribosyl 1,2-cyclic phosphodiesterase
LSRRFNIPGYVTPQTFAACKNLGKIDRLHFFECGVPFCIDELQVAPFSVSHDATDPAGLTLSFGENKIGIATDLGIATVLVKEHLKNCQVLYIESNHDPEMLLNGTYPWALKQRVKSRTGHLSNMDTRALITEILDQKPAGDVKPALQHVILAHLSEENNCPQKATIEVAKGLNGSGIALHVAGPDRPGKMIRLLPASDRA